MSHQDTANPIIPNIEAPESLKTILRSVVDKMTDAIINKGIDLETGEIPFPIGNKTLDKDEFIAFVMFDWITDINEVIDNFNIVISDIGMLTKLDANFEGSPYRRFHLLLRTYFYEFYRLREIFNRFVKTLKINNVIDKESANNIKATFHDAFKVSIQIRNNLVHTRVNWKGKKHQYLNLAWVSDRIGYLLLDKKSLEIITLQDAIKNIANDYIEILANEGNRIRLINQKIVDYLVDGLDYLASRL